MVEVVVEVVVVVVVVVAEDQTTLLILINLLLTLRFPIWGLPFHRAVLPDLLLPAEAEVLAEAVAEVAAVAEILRQVRRFNLKVLLALRVLPALRQFRFIFIIPNSTRLCKHLLQP